MTPPERKSIVALAASCCLLTAGAAGDTIPAVKDADFLRLLSSAWIEQISECAGSPDQSLRIRIYTVPDPREMGYEPLEHYCPRRRMFIAVSSCEKRPRHTLYALPERCGLRLRKESLLSPGRPNPVRPGPIATLRLKWVPEPWSPETGQALIEYLTVDITPESAEIVSIERRPYPESRE